jgi:hypothetical protein
MTPTTDLFLLVKALNKNEKRYFRLFASRHVIGKKNTYLKLFDALIKQKQYDEKAIKELFKKERMGKNLAAEKYRLYNLVLKSLSDFHAEISVESKLREQIHQVEVLFEKGLYAQGTKIIKKAKKISVENHKHLYSLELQRWAKRLISFNQYRADIEDQIASIFKETFYWSAQQKKILDIEEAYHKILSFQQIHGYTRNTDQIKKLKKIVDDISANINEKELDNVQKIYYYIMWSIYYRIIGNYKRSYEYQLKQQPLYREKPADNTELYGYVSYLNNLSLSQNELNKPSEALQTINRMRQAGNIAGAKKSSRVQTLAFLSYLNELSIYSTSGDFTKGIAVMKSIQKDFEKYSTTIGTGVNLTFWHFFAVISFGIGDPKKSMQWLNKIMNHPEQDVRIDVQCFARVFGLIVHYELHNEMLLPYYVKSVYRYLLKKQRLFKLETLILEFIRKKTPKINSSEDMKAAFSELKNDLIAIKKDKHEGLSLEDFDFISWLQSKIEDRPFIEVVKENARKDSVL